jgi:hypothetical protein
MGAQFVGGRFGLKASSDHFIIYRDQNEKSVRGLAERLELFQAAMTHVVRRQNAKPKQRFTASIPCGRCRRAAPRLCIRLTVPPATETTRSTTAETDRRASIQRCVLICSSLHRYSMISVSSVPSTPMPMTRAGLVSSRSPRADQPAAEKGQSSAAR